MQDNQYTLILIIQMPLPKRNRGPSQRKYFDHDARLLAQQIRPMSSKTFGMMEDLII